MYASMVAFGVKCNCKTIISSLSRNDNRFVIGQRFYARCAYDVDEKHKLRKIEIYRGKKSNKKKKKKKVEPYKLEEDENSD